MNELALVERIRKMAGFGGHKQGVALGIGDDCAIFQPPAGCELLLKTDQLIEGVHFKPRTPARAAGERALARALSDIAAMGGEPRACLVSLALPKSKSGAWAINFFQGLLRLARRTKTVLAGGDLSTGNHVHCSVMLLGVIEQGKALRRDGAKPGDLIYVSGRLGKPWNRPIRPRLELGRSLVGRASACMDISDGLALDLYRLCIASKVSAELDRVPVYPGSTVGRALRGGDDYELLFTLAEGTPAPRGVTRIGRIRAGKPGEIEFQGAKLAPGGWTSF